MVLQGRNSPNYGKGVVEADVLDAETLEGLLERAFSDPSYRPPTLPQAAIRISNLSQKEASFREVEQILASDPVLAGKVLAIARSPVYSSGDHPIATLSQALSRLGLATIRDIVMQVALSSRVFRCKCYQAALDSLVRHSTAVAYTTRRLCRMSSIDAEYSFLCGLLHDVGIAGGLLVLSEQRQNAPMLVEAWPAVYEMHEAASKVMAEHWGMPADLVLVLGHHHGVSMGGYPHPVAAAVRVANFICDSIGYEMQVDFQGMGLPKTRMNDLELDPCVEALGLSQQQVEGVAETLLEELVQVAGPPRLKRRAS